MKSIGLHSSRSGGPGCSSTCRSLQALTGKLQSCRVSSTLGNKLTSETRLLVTQGLHVENKDQWTTACCMRNQYLRELSYGMVLAGAVEFTD
jgi:hypothetical protein